jgi:hypothetical protein
MEDGAKVSQEFPNYTEQLTCKMEDAIGVGRLATINLFYVLNL